MSAAIESAQRSETRPPAAPISASAAPATRPADPQAKRPTIPWTLVNFWLDAAMLVVFLGLVWCSTVIRFVFPPALEAADWRLWSWSLDQWIGLQYALLVLLALLILLHLMFHWSWVCGVISSKLMGRGRRYRMDEGVQTIVGVGFMILLLNAVGLAIAVAVLSIEGPAL